VILAGVLLKIGTYGFLRFSIPMLPDASALFMPWILWLSVGGIIYGALVALVQTDIKRLIAYSSVSHLGFCMLGLFAFNAQGVEGGTLQMINHGLSTGGLFALVGMLYERYHTREISSYGGLARRAPWLTFFMLIFTFSSIGLPGMNGFAGEFLILMGMFQRAAAQAPPGLQNQLMTIAVLSVSGVVLGAWYMLWLIQRVFFGPLKEPQHESTGGTDTAHDSDSHAVTHSTAHHDDHHGSVDLCGREIFALMPLVIFIFWIGLQPHYFLRPMAPTLQRLTAGVERPLGVPASASAESTSMNPGLASATAR
jgi:NADH-quinone oxidoreductase subunit M